MKTTLYLKTVKLKDELKPKANNKLYFSVLGQNKEMVIPVGELGIRYHIHIPILNDYINYCLVRYIIININGFQLNSRYL